MMSLDQLITMSTNKTKNSKEKLTGSRFENNELRMFYY